MSHPTHPLLSLVESNRNGLKSMLTSYIDATVDSHYNAIKQNIVEMIQSGMIGPQQSYDITAFGTTLPQVAQSNTDQSSAHCLSEYSNDQLTRAQERQNTRQNEVSLSNTINTESVIKQEFDDGEEIDDGNDSKCEKAISNLAREYDDNTCDDTDTGDNENVSVGDDDETDIETNFDESQSQIAFSVSNNTQIKNQNDEENLISERSVSERNMEQSTPSTSGARSSTRKQIPEKVFGDLVQSNVNHSKCAKRKSDQVNKSLKKVKRKQTLEDDEDIDSDYNDGHEYTANNAIEEEIATECTTNPIQPNICQPNRIPKKKLVHHNPVPSESIESPSDNVSLTPSPPPRLAPPPTLKEFPANVDEWYGIIPHDCKKLRCKKQGKCQLEIMGEISNKFFIIPQAFEIFKTMDLVQVQGWLSADEVIEFTVKDCHAAARHMSQSITKVIVGPNFERVKRLPDPGKLAEFCNSIAKQFDLLNKRYRELYEIDKSIEPSFGGMLYDKIIRRLGTIRQQR